MAPHVPVRQFGALIEQTPPRWNKPGRSFQPQAAKPGRPRPEREKPAILWRRPLREGSRLWFLHVHGISHTREPMLVEGGPPPIGPAWPLAQPLGRHGARRA